MQIGWTAPSDDGGSPSTIDYAVYQLTDGGYESLVDTAGGATTYTVTGLVAGTEYFFKV